MSRTFVTAFTLAALGGAGVGLAQIAPEHIGGYAGSLVVDLGSGGGRGAVVNVYDNTPSAANTGISSVDLSTVWGDQMATTGTGTLEEFALTVFNSGSSAGPLLTADVAIEFRRLSDSSLIGGFTGAINFGAGLNPGFYSLVTFTGLDALSTPIVLDTTDIFVTQQRLSHTGDASRLGIASLDPVVIGSSPETMLVNGAPTSFSVPANPGYRLGVPAPASMALLGLSGLVAARRRR